MGEPVFIEDLVGEFTPSQVRCVWREGAGAVHPEVERLTKAWPRHVAEVTGRGGTLFNGQMVRCFGYKVVEGQLLIEAGPTDYATFYCTNYLNAARGDEIGWEHFANPLGISANVITADGWLLYGRRNEKVACHAGWVHTFGGTVDREDVTANGHVDVFGSMMRELREEAYLQDNELAEIICLGIIHDPAIRNPELIFDAGVRCTRAELEMRVRPDDPEHVGLVGCRDDAEAIRGFLAEVHPIAPVAVGSLVLHARRTRP